MAEPGPARPPHVDHSARLFTPAFVALTVGELAYFAAQGLTIPVTPLFAAGPLGADPAGVGLAVGAFSVTALLLRPLAGQLVDRRGRRAFLIGGALLYAAVTAAHAFVPDLAVLIGVRLALGVAEAFFFVAAFATLADLAPEDRMGEAVSFNSLGLYLGIAIGPLIGETLLDLGGFTMAWVGGASLAVIAALIATRIPETTTAAARAAGKRTTSFLSRPAIGPSLALFTGVAGMAGFFAFLALHARDLGMDGSRLVLLEFGLIVVACRVLFAKLPDRVPPFRLGAAALGLVSLGLALTATLSSASGLFIGAAVIAVGVAFATPAFFAAVFARVPPGERGAASGTTSLLLDLAFGGGPMLLGLVASAAGIPAAFGVAAVVAAVGAVATGSAALRPRARPAGARSGG